MHCVLLLLSVFKLIIFLTFSNLNKLVEQIIRGKIYEICGLNYYSEFLLDYFMTTYL